MSFTALLYILRVSCLCVFVGYHKDAWWSSDKAPHILNLGTRWRGVVGLGRRKDSPVTNGLDAQRGPSVALSKTEFRVLLGIKSRSSILLPVTLFELNNLDTKHEMRQRMPVVHVDGVRQHL
jgi:hypothetical protein